MAVIPKMNKSTLLWIVSCLCVEVQNCQEKRKGIWHKVIFTSLGKMSFACEASAKPSLKGKNKTNIRKCAHAMMQKSHISFYKLQWGILSEFCKPPFRSHKHGLLPPMGSCQGPLEEQLQKREDPPEQNAANIKPQVQHKYIDTAGKEVSFPSWKWFPVLLTKSYIIMGPVQPGKQNQQIKHASSLTFKIHYVSKYQAIHSVCKLSTCFAALLNSDVSYIRVRFFNVDWEEIEG